MVVSSKRLIGVHVGSCWHRALRGTDDGSRGGSSTGGSSSNTATVPPDILEEDASSLWMEPCDGQAEMLDHVAAAQGSYVNIPVSHA